MQKVLIIGATSAIAEAAARLFALRGDHLYLLARNQERLNILVQDLKVRGAASVQGASLDANQFEHHVAQLDTAIAALEGIDVVLIAHGILPDQAACAASFSQTLESFNTNAISKISLLTHLANVMERQKQGTIAVITSVAGDRGRQSNYVYGAAQSAMSTFLQGLRNRLSQSGVHVTTIKPGFVDTPMTADFKKGALWAKPDTIAQGIVRAIDKQQNEVYLPWFWRFIMMIILNIPEFIFKKMKL